MHDITDPFGFQEPQGEYMMHQAFQRSEMAQETRKAYHKVIKLRGLAQKAPMHVINLVCHNLDFNAEPAAERLDLCKAVNASFRSVDDPDPDNPQFVEDLEDLQTQQLRAREWDRLVYVFEPLDDHSYYRLAAELFCGSDLRANTKPYPLFKLMQGCKRHLPLPTGTIAAAVATFLAVATEELFQVNLCARMLLFDPARGVTRNRTHYYTGAPEQEGLTLLYWMVDLPRGLRYEVDMMVKALVRSRFKFSQLREAGAVGFSGYVFELPSSLCHSGEEPEKE